MPPVAHQVFEGCSPSVEAWRRSHERLEKLCGWAARPPIFEDRLSPPPGGRVGYRLKKLYRDALQLVLDPLTILEHL